MSEASQPARNAGVPVSHPAIWLGDFVRVVQRLGPQGAQATQVLELLGLTEAEPTRPPATLPEPPAGAPARDVTTEATPRRPSAARDLAPAASPADQPDRVESTIVEPEVPTARERSVIPPRAVPKLDDVLPDPPPPGDDVPLGLLPPAQQRAVLATLCSRPTPTGEPDVDSLVELLARREPLLTVPRQLVRSTRRGVQLLLDFGEGMIGFARDRAEIHQAIAQLAGRDGLAVLRFAGTPLDDEGAGPGPVWTWQPYEPPAWGRPVMIVSDLGTGRRAFDRGAVQSRWLEVAWRLRTAGCPVTALVPAPIARVPVPLRDALGVLTWDRTATVRLAAAAGRRAARLDRSSV